MRARDHDLSPVSVDDITADNAADVVAGWVPKASPRCARKATR